MPFEDPWRREGKRSPIDFERRLYEETGNALHVWRVLDTCLELMRAGVYRSDSLPTWILEYLERAAHEVRELFDARDETNDKQVATRLMDALGFKRAGQGVRDTAFSKDGHEMFELRLAAEVWRRKQKNPAVSYETIAQDIVDASKRNAALFTRQRLDGTIPAFAQPAYHQRPVSYTKVWRAWCKWRDFLEENARTY